MNRHALETLAQTIHLHVRGGFAVAGVLQAVLLVIQHIQLNAEVLVQAVTECGDRSVAYCIDHDVFATVLQRDLGLLAVVAFHLVGGHFQRRKVLHEVLLEQFPDPFAGHFDAGFFRFFLHHATHRDLHPARQMNAVFALQYEGNPTLAGLAVDAHHCFVRAAQVCRINRQVGDVPGVAGLVLRQTLADRVLVTAGKRGVHQFARIRMTGMHRNFGDVLHHADDFVHVGQVQLRIDAAGVQIHRHGDDVHVARTFAVAKQRAFDAIGACHHAQFGRCHATAAIIVGVQTDDNAVPIVHMTAEIFDLIRVHVGCGHFHGGGQVDDHLIVRRRLPHLDHRVADLNGIIHFGARVAFR